MNWFRSLLHRLHSALGPFLEPYRHRYRLLRQKYPSWGWVMEAWLRPFPPLYRAYFAYRRWLFPRAKRVIWPWLPYYRRLRTPSYDYRRLFPPPIRLWNRFYRWFLFQSFRIFFLFPSLLFAFALYRSWPSAYHLLWNLFIPFQIAVLTEPLGFFLSLFRPLLPAADTVIWRFCYDLKPVFAYYILWLGVWRFHLFAVAYGSFLAFWFVDLYRGVWPRHYRPDPLDFRELYLDFTDHYYANYLENAYGEETWSGVNTWWMVLQDVNDRMEHWTIWDIESSNFWILDDEEWLKFYWYLNRVCFAVYWPAYFLWLAVRFFAFFWIVLAIPFLLPLFFFRHLFYDPFFAFLRFLRFIYLYLVELLLPLYQPPFRFLHFFLHSAFLRLENRPKFEPWMQFTDWYIRMVERYGSIAKWWALQRRFMRAWKRRHLRRLKKAHYRWSRWARFRLFYVPRLFGPLLFAAAALFLLLSRLWAFLLFQLPLLLFALFIRFADLLLYLSGRLLPFGGGLPALLALRRYGQRRLAGPFHLLLRSFLTSLLSLRHFGERCWRGGKAAAVALHRRSELGGWRIARLLENLLLRRLLVGGGFYLIYLGWYLRVLTPLFFLLLFATPAGFSAFWEDIPHPPPYWDLAVLLFLLLLFRFSSDRFRYWLHWDHKGVFFWTALLTLSVFGALWGRSWVPSILYKSFWFLLGHLWIKLLFPLLLLGCSFLSLFGYYLLTLPALFIFPPLFFLLGLFEFIGQLAIHWSFPQFQWLGLLFDEVYLLCYPFLHPKVQFFFELLRLLVQLLNHYGSALVIFSFEKLRVLMEFYQWLNRKPFVFSDLYHECWLIRFD